MSKQMTTDIASTICGMLEDQRDEQGHFLLFHVEWAVAKGITDPELLVILAELYTHTYRAWKASQWLVEHMVKHR